MKKKLLIVGIIALIIAGAVGFGKYTYEKKKTELKNKIVQLLNIGNIAGIDKLLDENLGLFKSQEERREFVESLIEAQMKNITTNIPDNLKDLDVKSEEVEEKLNELNKEAQKELKKINKKVEEELKSGNVDKKIEKGLEKLTEELGDEDLDKKIDEGLEKVNKKLEDKMKKLGL